MALGSVQPFKPTGELTLAASTTSANGYLVGAGESLVIYNVARGDGSAF